MTMRDKKVIIIMIASLFVLSAILLGTQGIGVQSGSVNKTSSYSDLAVSNTYLGVNITLSNVYINNSYFTDYSLGIINGYMYRALYASNLTINSTGVLHTNGHNIYLTGTFDNKGHVLTGANYNPAGMISYGGSGGGARANNTTSSYSGSSTLVPGGMGTSKTHAQNGSKANFPVLNNTIIQAMYHSGFNNYLLGTDGQSYYFYNYSDSFGFYLNSGSGGNGLYLQANKIIAGNISSNGTNGLNNTEYNVYTGGGGAGSIILAHAGSNFTSGNVTAMGGKGGFSNKTIYTGGNGGSGTIYNYSYGNIAPISVGTQFHIPVITPGFVFKNSFVSVDISGLVSDNVVVNGNGTLKITDINTSHYNYNYSSIVYFNGSFDQKSYGTSSYNDSGQNSPSSNNNLVSTFTGPRSLNLLNAGILPYSIYSIDTFGSNSNLKLQTGVALSTPMGYVLTDKLTSYNPLVGSNVITIYIDQKSGVLLKLVTPYYSYEVTGTNIPLDHTSAPLPLNDIEIGGGVAAIVVVAGIVGYTMMQRKKKP